MSDLEIVKEFLVESYENLDRLDRDLIALEKDPGNREILASVFRTIHTIKGTSGFLAFNKLEAVAHVGESLLSRLRDGLLALNSEITTALLAMVDAVRQILGSIDSTGGEGGRNDQELISTLTRLLQQQAESKSTPNPPPAKTKTSKKDLAQLALNVGDILVKQGAAKKNDIPPAVTAPSASTWPARQADEPGGRTGAGPQPDSAILQWERRQRTDRAKPAAQPDHHRAARRRDEDPHAAHRQYLEQVSAHGPRRRHCAASKCASRWKARRPNSTRPSSKPSRIPLTHIVRNSVDHGIETPEVRSAAGKPAEGRLSCAPFTRAARSTSRSPTTVPASIRKDRNKAWKKG
jgi:two-component system, chemotaxis family, sensor kinase CheA